MSFKQEYSTRFLKMVMSFRLVQSLIVLFTNPKIFTRLLGIYYALNYRLTFSHYIFKATCFRYGYLYRLESHINYKFADKVSIYEESSFKIYRSDM